MKNKIVKIYCLYNPQTLKIRYIGRTISPLKIRLSHHISKAKHFKNNYPNRNGSYNINWINSLLRDGIQPKIKLLTTVVGWKESHEFEKCLIQKHLLKHNLVNGDDRGPGSFAKNINTINEKQRVEKIKKHFNKEENKINFYNKIYCYNKEGIFVKSYPSILFAEKELGIKKSKISNHMYYTQIGKLQKSINGFYFSHKLYDVFPFVRTEESYNRTIIYVDNQRFENATIFSNYYSLSNWDKTQLYKMIFTKRVKNLFKNKHVKIIKNGEAVLERNF